MITVNFDNLKKIKKYELIEEDIFKASEFQIQRYIDQIHSREQGFYKCIDDEKTVEKILNFSESVKGKYKFIVVLGIGGSSLGSICIDQSLKHLYKKDTPQLIILDNIDPTMIKEAEETIELKSTLFITITKSGGTPETLSQYFYFRDKCEKEKLDQKKHFVFITDPKKGLLRKIADEEKITTFDIPDNIGGRFSVLTPVGLLPAALIGVDIQSMIDGAKKTRDKFLSADIKENLSFQIALLQYLAERKGAKQNVMMPYNQKLIRFSDWYRQLLAESIGKEKGRNGKIVNIGITPINALGVTDQHSQAQLYNEGPNDKLFMFLYSKNSSEKVKIPNPKYNEVNYLKNTSFDQLIDVERRATQDALTSYHRPNITIEIDKIDEENLGELFMLFQGATAFLGEFYDIDTYDQPGVELAKNLTKEYLLKENG